MSLRLEKRHQRNKEKIDKIKSSKRRRVKLVTTSKPADSAREARGIGSHNRNEQFVETQPTYEWTGHKDEQKQREHRFSCHV